MILDLGYKGLPLVCILSRMSVVHTASSYYPLIYAHVFQMASVLEILPQEFYMHFLFLPWVPHASPLPFIFM
jgi:hypothetical protein